MKVDITTNGWCIHGVPYGLHWHCGQCTSSPMPSTIGNGWPPYPPRTAVGAPDYGDLFATLDRMTTAQLREFTRRFRERYSL